MSDMFKNDKPVYWDSEKGMLYWIEWEETGNSDIPHRHYIDVKSSPKSTYKIDETGERILIHHNKVRTGVMATKFHITEIQKICNALNRTEGL